MQHLIRFPLFLLICLISPMALYSHNLEGRVIDEYDQLIENVQILNTTNQRRTFSDKNGKFHLNDINIGDTLKFYHVGYEELITTISNPEKMLAIKLHERFSSLEAVTITPRINALSLISNIDLEKNPVTSSQDILRQVPGLFIGQHAGGGKAEQIFLRGFDVDHGTDVAISVDGMPVNMVSHAHGQGYADLHFIIPETVEKIDYGKGPYYANQGNFNTAGYVAFKTFDKLDKSTVKLSAGQFNSKRILSMIRLQGDETQSGYLALEHQTSDGAFVSPQNFYRTNLIAKYAWQLGNYDRLDISASHFSSAWDASGQIPLRAVESGLISRFGAIDDTEGGKTSRTNIIANSFHHLDDQSFIKTNLYYSKYDFELFSNFTFFLEDSINGDQIKQKESRNLFGLNSEYNRFLDLSGIKTVFQMGVGLRNDQSFNNELAHTLNRKQTLHQTQFGDINETNWNGYINTQFDFGKWRINPALRIDNFEFQYQNKLEDLYQNQRVSKSVVSPKLNILFNPNKSIQLYAKIGQGFHSNDSRVVINQTNKSILPKATGYDVGYIWKPTKKLLINMAYWSLFLEQEFVYVGDAGIVELSGETQRQGVDVSIRYQPKKWLFITLDANYAKAQALNTEIGFDFIPLAPDFTAVSGINIRHKTGFFGGINARFIDDRPANEDNSVVAKGYLITDINVGRSFKNLSLSIQIQNLFNTKWYETQFLTESRLSNEQQSVEEIHFTPGTPFRIGMSLAYSF